jgi:serine/threonine-protein kinase HipA
MTGVFAHTEIGGRLVAVGELHSSVRRGQVSSSFRYDTDFVEQRSAYAIEPALPLSTGSWPVGRALPRSFDDAAPDRWGRNLIAKRARADAAAAGTAPRQLDDRDYLLGVSDETRQGALRFSANPNGELQHPGAHIPKLLALPRLLRAADRVSQDDAGSLSAIKELLDAGTGSLGGARPKASVGDGDRLLIAKFPHHADQWDVMGWEKTALDLAGAAGIAVPHAELIDIDGRSVLLLERFDRDGSERIGYISAMTLLESDDGERRDYLEIAEVVTEHGSRTASDLRELWRRVAFSIAIHNTDDHLRNHGFLRRDAGWTLAPAFDLNPNPELGATRVTSVGGAARPTAELDALLESAAQFDLTRDAARQVLVEVGAAAARWPDVARSNGVPSGDVERFRPTLELTSEWVRAAAASH